MLTIAMDKIVLDFLCMYWLILWCRLQQKVKAETVIQIQTEIFVKTSYCLICSKHFYKS